MRALFFVALFVVSGTSFSGGQQATPSTPPTQAPAQPVRVKVYAVGPGVTAPELLPANQPPFPAEECKKKTDGKVVLSFLVDVAGQPRNIMFLEPLGSELDKFALLAVEADRFSPGTHEGIPVVIAQSVEVGLQTCIEEKIDDGGKKTYSLRLMSQPEQKLGTPPQPPKEAVLPLSENPLEEAGKSAVSGQRPGRGVTPPVLLSSVAVVPTDELRKAKYQGQCLLSLNVDVHGMPQNIRVERPLGMGIDEKAVEAASKFRFKPAMKNGVPVPMSMHLSLGIPLY